MKQERVAIQDLPAILRDRFAIALEVRCVLAMVLPTAILPRLLLTLARHRNNKLAVLLSDEVLACAG
jgi:hypothetical protein